MSSFSMLSLNQRMAMLAAMGLNTTEELQAMMDNEIVDCEEDTL